MNLDCKEKIFGIIRQETGIDCTAVDPQCDFRSQVSLDSIQLIDVTTCIEKTFSIELPITVMEVTTVNDFLTIVDYEINKKNRQQ